MQKICACGERMCIRLRTVIYSGKVEIENVPVYSCRSCQRSEVFPEIKPDLTGLIGKLGNKPEKQQLAFHEMNELAHLMVRASDKELLHTSIERIIEDRINQLLELLLIAKSMQDEKWRCDIEERLSQIVKHAAAAAKQLNDGTP